MWKVIIIKQATHKVDCFEPNTVHVVDWRVAKHLIEKEKAAVGIKMVAKRKRKAA